MPEPIRTPLPRILAGGPPSFHLRSHSNPYFQHTRTFTSEHSTHNNDSNSSQTPISSPVTCHIGASIPIKHPGPARLVRHNRSHTADTISRPLPVTTNVRIDSIPALSSSIFSDTTPIKFDLSPPESPRLSPQKEKDKWSFISNFIVGSPERSPSPSKLSSWFQGESAPISFGVTQSPAKEQQDPFQTYSMASENSYDKHVRTNNFFSSLFTGKSTTIMPMPQEAEEDNFFNLDIKRALYPQGQGDVFSPAAHKNLQQNAETLLARMQVAYRQKVLAMKGMKAEQEAQEEELEQAQTRTLHLKSQLDTLSSRFADQNHEMRSLIEELQEEKRLRREEADRTRTIRLIDGSEPFNRPIRSRESFGSSISTLSMLSDDDSIPSDQQNSSYEGDSPEPSTPNTPKSIAWQYKQRIPELEVKNQQLSDHGSAALAQENTELKNRVGHLEKELDNCLQILNGIGL